MRAIITVVLSGCVGSGEVLDFSRHHWPECSGHEVTSHRLSEVSQSEVQMDCADGRVTMSVKCVFGFGILSDTVCHENN